ncbi:MAG: glycosyltransferase family 4 protein [Deltaproteobacteria bacterium]|nr:glycosyltransferase family 4 protein [Deltaproteobacteria bacterium]
MKDEIQDTMTSGNSAKKRVLIIGPLPPPFGGIATVIDSIINSELSHDFSFEMFNRSESVYEPGSTSLERQTLKIKRAWNLFKKSWSGGYDFVHLHGSTSGFLGDTLVMIIAFIAGAKVLLHLHGTDWEKFYGNVSRFRRFYIRVGLFIPKRIVVLYDLWARNIRKIDSKIDVRVIRNFVPDCPEPDEALVDGLRRRLRIEPEEFVISSIGRVGSRKGSFDIVEAATRLSLTDSNFRILLVGGQEREGEMEQLQKLVSDKGMDKWVELVGEVDIQDVPLFLRLTDIFILPSYYEGMPMSIIEAMRSAKPIISTRVGAIPDMLVSGVSGMLINPGSPEELANSIHTLKKDPSLRKNLSNQARQTFQTEFETSRVVLSLRTLYQEMISS